MYANRTNGQNAGYQTNEQTNGQASQPQTQQSGIFVVKQLRQFVKDLNSDLAPIKDCFAGSATKGGAESRARAPFQQSMPEAIASGRATRDEFLNYLRSATGEATSHPADHRAAPPSPPRSPASAAAPQPTRAVQALPQRLQAGPGVTAADLGTNYAQQPGSHFMALTEGAPVDYQNTLQAYGLQPAHLNALHAWFHSECRHKRRDTWLKLPAVISVVGADPFFTHRRQKLAERMTQMAAYLSQGFAAHGITFRYSDGQNTGAGFEPMGIYLELAAAKNPAI